MDLLPPRILDRELLTLLAGVLAVRPDADDTAKLRLRLFERKFSWQTLADFAIDQDVIFPLVWALARRSLLLPVPEKRGKSPVLDHPTVALEAVYERHLQRRQEQCDQLLAIIATLNAANVAPLLLKGSRHLMMPTGDWCQARDMRDIDLLVRKDEVRSTVVALQGAGYRFEEGFVPVDQHLPELWLGGRPSAVEIHTEALAFSARKTLTTEEIWLHSVYHLSDCGAFFILPEEWHLLHGLLNHQISDRDYVRHILRIKALWEFTQLGDGLSVAGWHTIAEHMAARAQADTLGSIVVQAARLFGLAYPAGVTVSPAAHAHAKRTLAHASRLQLLRRSYFLLDQLRFGFARETMAIRYGLPESEVSVVTLGRHVGFLASRYRGQILRRIIGQGR